jgi:hypothetical protein
MRTVVPGRGDHAGGGPVTRVGCIYFTSLDRECGREATTGEHCDFHSVLVQLEIYDFHNPAPITVPESVRPLVTRILSDVMANCDTRPWKATS